MRRSIGRVEYILKAQALMKNPLLFRIKASMGGQVFRAASL
jgi:hypothetical protein